MFPSAKYSEPNTRSNFDYKSTNPPSLIPDAYTTEDDHDTAFHDGAV